MSNESISTKVTGRIAGSDDNQSGLISELNAYLKQGGLEKIETRAKDHGLDDTLRSWRDTPNPDATSASTVRGLIAQDEIDAFEQKTGQNESGVVSALATQLPRAIRHLAE